MLFCDKAFNIAKNPKYDEYQAGIASTLHELFDKKASGRAIYQKSKVK